MKNGNLASATPESWDIIAKRLTQTSVNNQNLKNERNLSSMNKIFKHIKYRLTRAKTYGLIIIASLSSSMPYLEGDDRRYVGIAITVLACLFSLVGTNNDSPTKP